MSVPASSPLPYQIATSTDASKIYKSPIAFQGQHFLATATQWTKNRILNKGDALEDATAGSPPSAAPPVAGVIDRELVREISFGPSGEALVSYANSLQLWEYDPVASGGVYTVSGSANNIDGIIMSSTLIPGTRQAIVQSVRKRTSILEVYNLVTPETAEPPKVKTLVLPPSSSGPGPYSVYCPVNSGYIAIIAANGLVTLLSARDFTPLALSGLEAALNADGKPLFDVQGRWLAIATPAASKGQQTGRTPLKLPPSGPLYERIVETVSNTAAASLKSLSDAGVAGIKAYLNKDQVPSPSATAIPGTSPTNYNDHQRPISVLNGLFSDSSNGLDVQIIDIPTESTICHFTPIAGVSALSLSPHDAILATVSTKGDSMYTYDVTFVPKEVSVTGRYVRGKLPARVVRIIWDSYGGLGIITADKGSVHWFDKRRSLNSTNKVWKLSAWGIQDAVFVPLNRRAKSDRYMQLLLLKQGQILVANVFTGSSLWKYDIPMSPVVPTDDVPADNEMNGDTGESEEKRAPSPADPLSFFELEPCLPYPFIHEDRRFTLSIYDESQGDPHDSFSGGDDGEPPVLHMFGRPIKFQVIDFGRPEGRADFSKSNGQLQHAMESMVISGHLNDDSTTVIGTPETLRMASIHPSTSNNGSITPTDEEDKPSSNLSSSNNSIINSKTLFDE
ncbi:hypothetical protein TRVA0_074S00188 [Trichomonascus vanleenenianus]|uniref:uncharacterized protein n=1 Tax=Trichomonascus vanleenenianus TaxID=2268995 RepID=UPI003EC9D47F